MSQLEQIGALIELEKRGALPNEYAPILLQLRARGVVPPRAEMKPTKVLGSENLGAAMVSAGHATQGLLSGAKDLWAQTPFGGGEDERAKIAAQRAEQNRYMKPLQDKHPVSTALGSALPYMAVPMGAVGGTVARGVGMLPNAGRVASALGKSTLFDAAATGAAMGGLDYDSSALGGAAGGALGVVGGKALGRAVSPATQKIRPAVDRLVGQAKKMGFRLTPAQVTGSRGHEFIEEGMKSNPFSVAPFARRAEHNQKVANRIATKAIGESGDEISDEVLGNAANRLGREFEKVSASTKPVILDDTFLTKLAEVDAKYSGAWGETSKISKLVDDALDDIAKGSIDAKKYGHLTSRLGKMARQKLRGQNSDPDAAFALFGVKEALDDAMEDSLGGAARKALQKARGEYRTLMLLESRGVIDSSTGNISLPKLANALKARDKSGYLRRKNTSDLYEAARIGQAFKSSVGDSGTATRQALPLTLGMGGTVGGLATYATGSPALGVAAGAAVPVGIRAASEAYNAVPGWATNTLMDRGAGALMPALRPLAQNVGGRIGAGALPGLLGSPGP